MQLSWEVLEVCTGGSSCPRKRNNSRFFVHEKSEVQAQEGDNIGPPHMTTSPGGGGNGDAFNLPAIHLQRHSSLQTCEHPRRALGSFRFYFLADSLIFPVTTSQQSAIAHVRWLPSPATEPICQVTTCLGGVGASKRKRTRTLSTELRRPRQHDIKIQNLRGQEMAKIRRKISNLNLKSMNEKTLGLPMTSRARHCGRGVQAVPGPRHPRSGGGGRPGRRGPAGAGPDARRAAGHAGDGEGGPGGGGAAGPGDPGAEGAAQGWPSGPTGGRGCMGI